MFKKTPAEKSLKCVLKSKVTYFGSKQSDLIIILPNVCHKFVNNPGITTKATATLIPINIVKKAIDIAGKPIPDVPFTKPPIRNIIETNNIESKSNIMFYFL